MAFYSSCIKNNINSVDDEDDLTIRTLANDFLLNASTFDGGQRSTTRSHTSTFRTVRYVNSATFIEKDCHNNGNETYYNENVNEDEKNENEEIEENDGNYLPQLNIKLQAENDSFNSSNNLTYSFRNVKDVTDKIKNFDAYNEWLQAKNIIKKHKINLLNEKLKLDNEMKLLDTEQRKKLSKEKLKEWFQNKKLLNEKQNSNKNDNYNSSSSKIKDNNNIDSESNYNAWLTKKLKYEKSLKEKINEEKKLKESYINLRQKASKLVYKNWLKTVPCKPKPVPLNKGFYSLKGSISEMYINPQPWTPLEVKSISR